MFRLVTGQQVYGMSKFWRFYSWELSILSLPTLDSEGLSRIAQSKITGIPIYRLLVQEGVVELCLKSLLRHKLEREAISVGDEVTRFLLSEAMTTLCK